MVVCLDSVTPVQIAGKWPGIRVKTLDVPHKSAKFSGIVVLLSSLATLRASVLLRSYLLS
jgi:hypothetical protein